MGHGGKRGQDQPRLDAREEGIRSERQPAGAEHDGKVPGDGITALCELSPSALFPPRQGPVRSRQPTPCWCGVGEGSALSCQFLLVKKLVRCA